MEGPAQTLHPSPHQEAVSLSPVAGRVMNSAISELMEHEGRLLTYISRRIRDKSRAKDVLQEAMLRLVEQSQKQALSNPLAYAFRVVDSVIYADARRAPANAEPLDCDLKCDLPLADEVLEQKQRVKVFQEALLKLSAVRRDIFLKRHIEGKSRQEIAEDMNLNVETVKKHLVRSMVELADALADAEDIMRFVGASNEGGSSR